MHQYRVDVTLRSGDSVILTLWAATVWEAAIQTIAHCSDKTGSVIGCIVEIE